MDDDDIALEFEDDASSNHLKQSKSDAARKLEIRRKIEERLEARRLREEFGD